MFVFVMKCKYTKKECLTRRFLSNVQDKFSIFLQDQVVKFVVPGIACRQNSLKICREDQIFLLFWKLFVHLQPRKICREL